ncbi:MAG: MBL fold metallo-hydrolase [Gammaproteobacteria bacterium]|nr:MBL fold metallo-hydrolase [Gammaproteobacteria bacterium]MBT5604231.1 MBL fold metallo-hydrolase [Gammaproteobacteria bacterium]MBT6245350.1 MBL fold metallo-hydrolase [Gammaproteobacteria bacterium]
MQVAENWYAQTSLADGVTLIREQHVSPDVGCNIWHIKGRQQDLLIDSGLGVVSLRDNIALLSQRPVLALASHTHFDHVGCHHEFENRLCHPAESAVLAAPDGFNTVWSEFRASVPTDDMLQALPYSGFDLDTYRVQPAAPTQLINEGDEIDLGDRLFRVFHMPGHSPGSVCLYEDASKTIFVGDVLYDGELLDALYHSDVSAYQETLARLREIPAEVFHCGHYASFGRQRMNELIDAYQASKLAK